MKAEWQGDLLLAFPTTEMVLVFFIDQDLVDQSRGKEREKKREREQDLSGYMENQWSPYTGLVLLMKAQGVLSRRSWKPRRESEFGRFPCSNENEDRKKDAGDPGL